MSIIKDIKDIYNNIQKPEPKVQPVSAINDDLMKSVTEKLNKQPLVAPNINRKSE